MEYSCRLHDPSIFNKFRRKSNEREYRGKFYGVIYGRLKKGGAWIQQSFYYPVPLWTKLMAQNHCKIYDGKFETSGQKGAKTLKRAVKKNPAKRQAIHDKVSRAIRLFKKFRGEEPEYLDKIKIPVYNVGLLIGDCDGILYTTIRDGKKEEYIHKFSVKARPLLCSTHDGKHIFLVGGSYNFTADGIVDRKGGK